MKILLAMDTSPASQIALDQTAARPWPAGAKLEILGVVEPSHLWTTPEVAEEARRRANETVQQGVEKLRACGWDATGVVASGDAKTVILDRIETRGADFVVVGSHGASALTRILLGNVAATVLRYAPCSVEIVRARVREKDSQIGSRVLLATDGSECAERAARSIAERPFPVGTEVRILSAVEFVVPTAEAFLEPFVNSALLESQRMAAMKRAQGAITTAAQILSSTDCTVSESISVLLESPKTVILDEATNWEADLVVVGSHGHHGFGRYLLGSVSEAVALHAACSVEVIRGRDWLP
jgi:nucleotide-binding universal stress UspA family protein